MQSHVLEIELLIDRTEVSSLETNVLDRNATPPRRAVNASLSTTQPHHVLP